MVNKFVAWDDMLLALIWVVCLSLVCSSFYVATSSIKFDR